MLEFLKARTHMVESQIQTNGVITPAILQAFQTVPREEFVPKTLRPMAYADEDVSIGKGRFLLEPTVHAKMVQAMNPKASDLVLDIGCGTGYSSAILAPLVTTVIAVEEDREYLERAAQVWVKTGANNVVGLQGPLNLGSAVNGPYDLIFINGSVAEIPADIVGQLAPQGRLIAVVRKPGEIMGQATIAQNLGGGRFSAYNLFSAASPYVPGFEPKPAFVF